MKKKSKRFKNLIEKKIKDKKLSLKDIIELVKKNANTKFEESIDVSLRINLKQSKGGDFSLRTTVQLPNGSGKKEKIAVLCEPDKISEAKKSGADIVGSDDLIEKISGGKFGFTKLICTPAMMGKIGKHGKVLGPKGLMPNPKLGTVTKEIKDAVTSAKSGQVKFKNDKSGIVHAGIGKISFSDEKILENLKVFYSSINKSKPDSVKGSFIKKVTIASTMGVGLQINQASLR